MLQAERRNTTALPRFRMLVSYVRPLLKKYPQLVDYAMELKCPVCGAEFSSAVYLVRHLQHSKCTSKFEEMFV